MATKGWKQLIPTKSPFEGKGRFPFEAYSEFMPAPGLVGSHTSLLCR